MVNDQETPKPWRTSSWSNGGACVEVAVGKDAVFIRDSKKRNDDILAVSPLAWKEFISAIQHNDIA